MSLDVSTPKEAHATGLHRFLMKLDPRKVDISFKAPETITTPDRPVPRRPHSTASTHCRLQPQPLARPPACDPAAASTPPDKKIKEFTAFTRKSKKRMSTKGRAKTDNDQLRREEKKSPLQRKEKEEKKKKKKGRTVPCSLVQAFR